MRRDYRSNPYGAPARFILGVLALLLVLAFIFVLANASSLFSVFMPQASAPDQSGGPLPPAMDSPSHTEDSGGAPEPPRTEEPSLDETEAEGIAAFDGFDAISRHALLISLEEGSVLYSKAADEPCYPASLTKIMTAIVAIEALNDIEEKILLTEQMFEGLADENASMAGFVPGEEVRVIDLLYGLMLPSGAEASNAAAVASYGSAAAFIEAMNDKAAALSMSSSHFTNVHGLHDENHYTSVSDLALLLEYSLKNETFRQIFTTERYSTPPTNKNSEGLSFVSTMFKSLSKPEFEGGSIKGGKTGYTKAAGLCLASLAEKYGREYIFITTGADGSHYTAQYNIMDALSAYKTIPAEV